MHPLHWSEFHLNGIGLISPALPRTLSLTNFHLCCKIPSSFGNKGIRMGHQNYVIRQISEFKISIHFLSNYFEET